jgi:hypothetical protein
MKSDYGWLFLGIGIFAITLILFRRSSPVVNPQQVNYVPVPVSGGRRYINKETVEIEWNSDCLPVKITTNRDASQS